METETRPPVAPNDHRGHVWSRDTSPAYKATCQIAVQEALASGTATFGLFKLRGIAMTGKLDQPLVFFHAQMPPGWGSGPEAPEVHEAAISGRTPALAAGDRLHLGIPWLHAYGEMVFTFDVASLALARAELVRQLTPA